MFWYFLISLCNFFLNNFFSGLHYNNNKDNKIKRFSITMQYKKIKGGNFFIIILAIEDMKKFFFIAMNLIFLYVSV